MENELIHLTITIIEGNKIFTFKVSGKGAESIERKTSYYFQRNDYRLCQLIIKWKQDHKETLEFKLLNTTDTFSSNGPLELEDRIMHTRSN